MTEEADTFLAHYGIPGMKWGRRGGRSNKPSLSRSASKEGPSEDAVKVTTIRSRAKVSGKQALSNNELQTVITRMNLEQQYNNLNSKSKNAGQKFVEDLALNTVKQTAADYAKKGIGAGIKAAVSAVTKK